MGGSSYGTPTTPASLFPQLLTSYLYFEEVPQLSKVQAKVVEFARYDKYAVGAGEGKEGGGTGSGSGTGVEGMGNGDLSSSELESIESLCLLLSATSHYHSSTAHPAQIQSTIKPTLAWDAAHLFPLFDILRVVCIHPHAADLLSRNRHLNTLLERVIQVLGTDPSAVPFATVLTAARFLCNCFKHPALRAALAGGGGGAGYVGGILAVAGVQVGSPSKLVRVSVTRLLANCTILLASTPNTTQTASIVSTMCAYLGETEAPETVLNCVRTLGTLQVQQLIPPHMQADVRGVLQGLGSWGLPCVDRKSQNLHVKRVGSLLWGIG
ncbi:PUL domain-containing protein [Ochromonadaceae sp. CCMP2298]|nr:PUL domain-containing protein [Ochromonadaceae sp. CCMP2298]